MKNSSNFWVSSSSKYTGQAIENNLSESITQQSTWFNFSISPISINILVYYQFTAINCKIKSLWLTVNDFSMLQLYYNDRSMILLFILREFVRAAQKKKLVPNVIAVGKSIKSVVFNYTSIKHFDEQKFVITSFYRISWELEKVRERLNPRSHWQKILWCESTLVLCLVKTSSRRVILYSRVHWENDLVESTKVLFVQPYKTTAIWTTKYLVSQAKVLINIFK